MESLLQEAESSIYLYRKLYGYKKDILVNFLKNQIQESRELVEKLEQDSLVEQDLVRDFFFSKGKLEKKMLRSVLN